MNWGKKTDPEIKPPAGFWSIIGFFNCLGSLVFYTPVARQDVLLEWPCPSVNNCL